MKLAKPKLKYHNSKIQVLLSKFLSANTLNPNYTESFDDNILDSDMSVCILN